MKDYLITAPAEKTNWHQDLHLKGLKVNYHQDDKCLITASDGALVEIKTKNPEFKIELIMN